MEEDRAFEGVVNAKTRQKVEVYHEILQRLRESQSEEFNKPGFENELWAHFDRLPVRYAMDVNVERPKDVLEHKRLLHLASDPATRPAFGLRLVQVFPASDVSNGEDGDLRFFRHLYEITISTIDKPKLLSQLTSLLTEIGLNIKEAHAFSTIDGYSLGVFVVDGWTYAEMDQLKTTLEKEIPKIEMLYRPRHVSSDGNDEWEVDYELLKFQYKIVGGAFEDLYKGTLHGQDVAIKVLKPSHLDQRVQREFAQEVYILRLMLFACLLAFWTMIIVWITCLNFLDLLLRLKVCN